MKTAAKGIIFSLWLVIAAFELLLSGPAASAKSPLGLQNCTWKIFSLAAQTSQPNPSQVKKPQQERAPPQVKEASDDVLAPETTASVPDNVFAYNPAPKGVVIQQDGPLVTSNQAAVAQGDLSGVITDTARMLSAPNNVTNQLPGLVIGQFDMVTDPGPLASFPSNPAANFASGKYTAITLTEDVVLYRGGSSAGSPLGQWFTAEPPSYCCTSAD